LAFLLLRWEKSGRWSSGLERPMTITDTPTPTDDGTLVLSISDAALGTVLGIRDQEDDAEALGLRVEITGSKGAEFTYDLGFEELTSADADTVVEEAAGGLKVMIPAATVEKLRGSVLDHSRAGAQGGLVIRNPNRP